MRLSLSLAIVATSCASSPSAPPQVPVAITTELWLQDEADVQEFLAALESDSPDALDVYLRPVGASHETQAFRNRLAEVIEAREEYVSQWSFYPDSGYFTEFGQEPWHEFCLRLIALRNHTDIYKANSQMVFYKICWTLERSDIPYIWGHSMVTTYVGVARAHAEAARAAIRADERLMREHFENDDPEVGGFWECED